MARMDADTTDRPRTAKLATLYRMVMPGHVCPYGVKSKWLLESRGYTVEDRWLRTRAETDAARAKQALKMAESRLEDETRRRVDAERAADEEARLRRHAEEQLRAYQMRAAGMPSPPMTA